MHAVARPIGVVPHWQMWLQERVPGVTCWAALTSGDAEQVATRVAEAAHKLHRAKIKTRSSHTTEQELEILHDGLQRLARAIPRLGTRLEKLYQRCAALASDLPGIEPAGIHRDFYPDQLLLDGDRLVVVDHDLYCLGDPCLDIGNFCGHLVEWSLRQWNDPTILQPAGEALVDRYLALNGKASRRAIDTYTILTIARHVFLCTQYADRKSAMERLLDHCECAVSACLGSSHLATTRSK